jgi:phenylalanyl-tRNA synthetase beta subunit
MRVPYSWLREVVSAGAPGWDVTPAELELTLVRIGHEVEEVVTLGPVDGPLSVGRVTNIEELTEFKKPIRACLVDVGEEKPREIVCGATNFAVGDLVVVALPGATLPGGFVIATRKTYGRTSDGMICSAAELGLGADHSGILVLPPASAEPGADGAEVLGLDDVVFGLAITPDRGYCMSVRGLAREIACAYDLNFVDPASDQVVKPLPADGEAWPLTVQPETGVRRFALRPVTGIDPASVSPWWLQRRLQLCGIRATSPAVDVTNYVMLELGQPMHAHDSNRISGGLGVRFARPGETVVTLDGIERKLDPADVLIVDDVATAAIGGVMGAASTEVRADSTDVLLEAAVWDPAGISRTQRRLHLPSEAARRYERTVDPAISVRHAARRHRRGSDFTDVDRLAGRPAACGLVTAADHDRRRPARPLRRGGVCRGHDGQAAYPDRCRCGRHRVRHRGGLRRHIDRDATQLATRLRPARRSRRGGAAAGRARGHPVGAAVGARRPRTDRGAEAPPRDRQIAGTVGLRRDSADTVSTGRCVRPVGVAAR